jgi:hypothetical protein
MNKRKDTQINRKFRVAMEVGSTFFGYSSVDKKRNYFIYIYFIYIF